MSFTLHPLIDNGLHNKNKPDANFTGGTLKCHCLSNPITVSIKGNVMHNHACGCSQCWKPKGALFSIVGVVPVVNMSVTAHSNKLKVINEKATIRRHACKECGVHMFGRVVDGHAFTGLDFVHVELSEEEGWQEVQFAAFVSSIIEQGFPPEKIGDVRKKFKAVCFLQLPDRGEEIREFVIC